MEEMTCPLCGRKKLIKVKALTRQEAQERLDRKAYSHRIEEEELGNMAENENNFVEQNFKDEEKYGMLFICPDCGIDFRETERATYLRYKTRISKEEFAAEYRKAIERQISKEIPDAALCRKLADMAVKRVCEEDRNIFYKEFLEDILTEMALQEHGEK